MIKNKKFIRFSYILAISVSLMIATYFVLKALEEKIVFFYTPTKIEQRKDHLDGYIRVGGLVKEKSVTYSHDGLNVNFSITDNKNVVNVVYNGILPDLFRENQGVVVEGNFNYKKNIFFAKKVLAKHDENYLPPQVKKALEGDR